METKFGGIGGNLIWWMQINVNFGGNLIWRTAENIYFGRNLICRISTKLNMINAFCFFKKLYIFFAKAWFTLAKKESQLKFYRMHSLHTVSIFVFFMLQTEPGRSGLDLWAIYARPIKIQFSLFVEQLRHVHFNYIKISNFYQWI